MYLRPYFGIESRVDHGGFGYNIYKVSCGIRVWINKAGSGSQSTMALPYNQPVCIPNYDTRHVGPRFHLLVPFDRV